jgi:hypothetical protein
MMPDFIPYLIAKKVNTQIVPVSCREIFGILGLVSNALADRSQHVCRGTTPLTELLTAPIERLRLSADSNPDLRKNTDLQSMRFTAIARFALELETLRQPGRLDDPKLACLSLRTLVDYANRISISSFAGEAHF